jgi:hypothetical protein
LFLRIATPTGTYPSDSASQFACHTESSGGIPRLSHRKPGKKHAIRITTTPGGLQAILLAREREERRDIAGWTNRLWKGEDEETVAVLRDMILDEYAQAKVLRRLYMQSSPCTVCWLTRR